MSLSKNNRTRYFGDWTDINEVRNDFSIAEEAIQDREIIYACYTYEDYSGSAHVIFQRNKKLYEVYGGHCSCNGLEGQWDPDEVTWDQLAMRKVAYDYSQNLADIVNRHVPRA